MLSILVLAQAILCQTLDPTDQPVRVGDVAVIASPDSTEVYKSYRSALADAKNRAATKPLSLRGKALEAAPAIARSTTTRRYGIAGTALDVIIKAGEAKDGTSKKKAERQTNLAAKARQEQQIEILTTPPPQPVVSPDRDAMNRWAAQREALNASNNTERVRLQNRRNGFR